MSITFAQGMLTGVAVTPIVVMGVAMVFEFKNEWRRQKDLRRPGVELRRIAAELAERKRGRVERVEGEI